MWIEYIYNFELISRNIFHMRINFCLFQSVPYYIVVASTTYEWKGLLPHSVEKVGILLSRILRKNRKKFRENETKVK